MVDKKSETTEITKYAEEVAKKVLSYQKTKKFHYVFLKNINELLLASLDTKELNDLEKEVSNSYNNKLKVNHKKKKENPKKINLKDDYEDPDDYIEYDDDDYDDYKGFN